jgi:short-subunit dehydrogenase
MKFLILGGSKGLGLSLIHELTDRGFEAVSVSRKNNFDFSKQELWPMTLEHIKKQEPYFIIYSAGGGPFGRFQDKDFGSHEWAWRVNFQFPAYLLHDILKAPKDWKTLKGICFIGSAVADQKPDPMAASYAAAKHALRGLISSVQLEEPNLKVDLYSAPYMDTDLLPKNAWPRQQEGLVINPRLVAQDVLKQLNI